jgi:hypothetical protein
MAQIDIFNDIAPEFAAELPARVLRFLTYAQADVNALVWKSKNDRAVATLAAHMITIANRGASGAGGPLIGEKLGDMEYHYAAPAKRTSHASDYATTAYGVEFLRLRATVLKGPLLL